MQSMYKMSADFVKITDFIHHNFPIKLFRDQEKLQKLPKFVSDLQLLVTTRNSERFGEYNSRDICKKLILRYFPN